MSHKSLARSHVKSTKKKKKKKKKKKCGGRRGGGAGASQLNARGGADGHF